jgi:hypothetical protein
VVCCSPLLVKVMVTSWQHILLNMVKYILFQHNTLACCNLQDLRSCFGLCVYALKMK